ncbi:ParA family protein [Sulfurisphaera javensis]|uniref:ParA family protein n=1 Tax=Sulfurisphaera javensis TaxID=2049879 RepID=A0AAT9GSI0_9CREN
MRIAFHGFKGGIGKSTLSLMFAKALAEEGKKVLFIDRDLMSWASELAKINEDGLLIQIGLGKEPKNFSKEIKIGSGSVEVVKLFSTGIKFYKVLYEFNKEKEFKEIYKEFLRSKVFDYIILDNPVFLSWDHNPIKYETIAYNEVFPNDKAYVILVSDPLSFSIDDSIIYLRRISSEAPIFWSPLAGIINMAIEEKEKYVDSLKKLMSSIGFYKGVIVRFYDSIFQFYGSIEDLPVVPEIKVLAERVMNNDMKEEIIV